MAGLRIKEIFFFLPTSNLWTYCKNFLFTQWCPSLWKILRSTFIIKILLPQDKCTIINYQIMQNCEFHTMYPPSWPWTYVFIYIRLIFVGKHKNNTTMVTCIILFLFLSWMVHESWSASYMARIFCQYIYCQESRGNIFYLFILKMY